MVSKPHLSRTLRPKGVFDARWHRQLAPTARAGARGEKFRLVCGDGVNITPQPRKRARTRRVGRDARAATVTKFPIGENGPEELETFFVVAASHHRHETRRVRVVNLALGGGDFER